MQLAHRLKFNKVQLGFLFIILAITALIYYGRSFLNILPFNPQQPGRQYRVQRVIDGDTLLLEDGTRIRLIGVDTPEVHHPELPIQRFAEEAMAFTKKVIEGHQVTLKFDDGPEKDKYGRLLAYAFVDKKLLNKEIIKQGYGYAMTRFPYTKQSEFLQAEQEARAMQRGLWNYSLTDARITNLVNRYEQLRPEAKEQLEKVWDELLERSLVPKVPPKRISWKDAANHYGEYCTVEGVIVRTYNSGKACFLNFHQNWKKYFSAVIFARRFNQFPGNPERHYLNKTVRITGYIKEYKGSPEIILDSPDQIEIVE